MAASEPRRPLGLSILVGLYDVGAVFTLIAGVAVIVIGLIGAGVATRVTSPGAAAGVAVLAVTGLLLVAWSLGVLMMGYYLWNGFNWARIGFMTLLAVGMLFDSLSLFGKLGSAATAQGAYGWVVPALLLVLQLLFLVMLNVRQTREYCSHHLAA
jgi:hypothetical protein